MMTPALGLLALFLLSRPRSATASTTPATTTTTAPKKNGVTVVGQVLQIPLSDGQNAIVAKLNLPGALDAIVIARGTVYGSSKGQAAVLRCGSEAEAKAIANEIRGKF
jgi:hypothetical protein